MCRHRSICRLACAVLLGAALPNVLAQITLVATAATLAGGGGGTVAGFANGAGTVATFNLPTGVAVDANATFALVVDQTNHILRRVNVSNGAVTTVAGKQGLTGTANGIGTVASFRSPRFVALAPTGGTAYVVRIASGESPPHPRGYRLSPAVFCRPMS